MKLEITRYSFCVALMASLLGLCLPAVAGELKELLEGWGCTGQTQDKIAKAKSILSGKHSYDELEQFLKVESSWLVLVAALQHLAASPEADDAAPSGISEKLVTAVKTLHKSDKACKIVRGEAAIALYKWNKVDLSALKPFEDLPINLECAFSLNENNKYTDPELNFLVGRRDKDGADPLVRLYAATAIVRSSHCTPHSLGFMVGLLKNRDATSEFVSLRLLKRYAIEALGNALCRESGARQALVDAWLFEKDESLKTAAKEILLRAECVKEQVPVN